MSPVKSVESLGRAPVPEWEEAARAAWPGRVPTGLSAFAGRHHLSVLVISLAVLLLAAWLLLRRPDLDRETPPASEPAKPRRRNRFGA